MSYVISLGLGEVSHPASDPSRCPLYGPEWGSPPRVDPANWPGCTGGVLDNIDGDCCPTNTWNNATYGSEKGAATSSFD
jgi:hypothetical protein